MVDHQRAVCAGASLSDTSSSVRGFDLDALILALSRQRRTFFAVLGAALTATLVASLLATKQYTATSLIQLMPRAGQEMEVNEVVKYDDGGYLESRDRARTQIQIILSRSVRQSVVELYNERGHTDFDTSPTSLGILKDSMYVAPREDTQLVEIKVTHIDPEKAALLANLISAVYVDSNLKWRTDAAQKTQSWLEGQADSTRSELDSASAKVRAFKEEHDLADVDEAVDGISTQLVTLQKALSETTTQRKLLEGSLRNHERLLAKGETQVLIGMFQDPALEAMAKEHATIVTKNADVLARYGEKHPEHQQAVARIQRVEDIIAAEVARNVESERSQVDTLRRQESELEGEIDRVKIALLDKQRLEDEYDTLKAEEDRAKRLFGSLGEREAEVELQASTRLNNVRIVDEALPPSRPSTPNIPLNLIMGLAVGIAGGLGLALLRDRLDDTIVTAQDVAAHLEKPLLGAVPSLPKDVPENERALYSHLYSRSLTSEAFRSIRSFLQTFVAPGLGRTILITSSVPGEGKSCTATGLAIAFAKLGARTLIIDADLRRPRLDSIFELPQSPGLSDLLAGNTTPKQIIHKTDIDGLHVLPCGSRVDNPNEMLSSHAMPKLLSHLRKAFHVVIVDSAPAALVSDAMTLGRQVDGVCVVVRSGLVDHTLADKTIRNLSRGGATVLGVILNDAPTSKDISRYGSTYYDDRPRTERFAAT